MVLLDINSLPNVQFLPLPGSTPEMLDSIGMKLYACANVHLSRYRYLIYENVYVHLCVRMRIHIFVYVYMQICIHVPLCFE